MVTPDPATVRRQPCPHCNAAPTELCTGTRGERQANHIERVLAAQEADTAPTREHRYYDDDPGPQPRNPDAINPKLGRHIAYRSCVEELMRHKAMSRDVAERRASDLLAKWLES